MSAILFRQRHHPRTSRRPYGIITILLRRDTCCQPTRRATSRGFTMTRPPPRLPRRHAQRQALNYGRAETPPSSTPSRGRLRFYKPPAKKEKRLPTSSASDSTGSDSDSGSESSSDSDNDSGYSSATGLAAKAEYYRQKKAEFVTAGPTLSNPCPTTKKQMEGAERKWNL